MTYLSVMWIIPPSYGMSALMTFVVFPRPDEILSSDGAVSLTWRRKVEWEIHRLLGEVTLRGLVSITTRWPRPSSSGAWLLVSRVAPGSERLALSRLVVPLADWNAASRRADAERSRSFSVSLPRPESEGAKTVFTCSERYNCRTSESDWMKFANWEAPDATRASTRLGRDWDATKAAMLIRKNTVAWGCNILKEPSVSEDFEGLENVVGSYLLRT